jgi:hypothetical protein
MWWVRIAEAGVALACGQDNGAMNSCQQIPDLLVSLVIGE